MLCCAQRLASFCNQFATIFLLGRIAASFDGTQIYMQDTHDFLHLCDANKVANQQNLQALHIIP
eukprot:scaffold209369_cov19-Tisochrysis_lutea.AAC.3